MNEKTGIKVVSLVSQVAHQTGAYRGFCSMNRLGLSLLSLDLKLVHRRVTPSTHLYTWVERGSVRVKCLAQEHDTMPPASARNWTALSRDQRSYHEATAPHTLLVMVTVVLQLGWKAKEDILRKMPTTTTASSTNTVTSTSITTVVSSHSAATVTETSKTSILFTPTTTVTAAATAASKASIVTTSVSSTHTSAVTEGSKTNAVATSVSLSTPTPAVAAASTAAKGRDSTPVSSLADSSSKPAVITNLLEVKDVILITEKKGWVEWGGINLVLTSYGTRS